MPIRSGKTIKLQGVKPDAVEVVSKRSEVQVVFDLGGGKQQYLIFGAPIHYHDGRDWQPIDTRWTAGHDTDFEITKAMYGAKLAAAFDTKDALVTLSRLGQTIAYAPSSVDYIDATGKVENIGTPQKDVLGVVTEHDVDGLCPRGRCEWKDAFGKGLHFAFDPSTHFFGKELILDALPVPKKPPAFLALALQFASALTPAFEGVKWDKASKKEAKSAEFKDASDLFLWGWRPPVATDANGNTVDCKIVVEAKGGKQCVSVLVPYSWLQTAAYPVTVDPDTYYGATTDGRITGYHAVYATARAGTGSVGHDVASAYFEVGQSVPSTYQIRRGFLEFDTSGIDDGATITQANLYMTVWGDVTNTDFTVRIHKYNWTSPITSGNRAANFQGALASTYDTDWRSTSGIATNTPYASSNLDTTWIQKGATLTQYAILSSLDVANTPPVDNEILRPYTQESATQAYRPYLSITVTTSVNADVTWPTAEATAVGIAPTISAAASIAAPTAEAVAVGIAPTVAAGAVVEAPTAEATAVGIIPTILAAAVIAMPTAAAVAEGIPPTVTAAAVAEFPTAEAVAVAFAPESEVLPATGVRWVRAADTIRKAARRSINALLPDWFKGARRRPKARQLWHTSMYYAQSGYWTQPQTEYAWSGTGYIYQLDDLWAISGVPPGVTTDGIIGHAYGALYSGMDIPIEAIIVGVTISLFVKREHEGEYVAQLWLGFPVNSVIGTPRSFMADIGEPTWIELGGLDDLWGYELTPEIVNSESFGYQVNVHNTHPSDNGVYAINVFGIKIHYML